MEFYDFNDEYLERLRAGDVATVQHFIIYFGKLLRIKLRGEVASREDAEDLSQITFLRIFVVLSKKEDGIREGKRLGAYVFGICKNVVREHRRKHKLDPEPAEPGMMEAIPDTIPSAYDFLELGE